MLCLFGVHKFPLLQLNVHRCTFSCIPAMKYTQLIYLNVPFDQRCENITQIIYIHKMYICMFMYINTDTIMHVCTYLLLACDKVIITRIISICVSSYVITVKVHKQFLITECLLNFSVIQPRYVSSYPCIYSHYVYILSTPQYSLYRYSFMYVCT